MPAFFLAFLVTLLLTAAGRESVRAARLSLALGPAPGLIAGLALSSIFTIALAVWAGQSLRQFLPGPAHDTFLAVALVVAALELLVLRAPPAPREPTRSTGAMVLVLLAAQLVDATRLAIAALVVASGEPELIGAGGVAGCGAALATAVVARDDWERRLPLRWMKVATAATLLVAAASLAIPGH